MRIVFTVFTGCNPAFGRHAVHSPHNTQLCSYRPVTEAGLPAEGTAGCMSVLLCRRADWFQQMARCAMGLGSVGQAVSAMCSAPPASGEAASLSRRCSIFSSGRQCAHGFHRTCQAAVLEGRVLRAAVVCVRFPESSCVRQRARWFHRTRPRSGVNRAQVLHAECPAVVRIDGNRASAPALEMRKGGGAHQHQAFGVSG